MFYVAEALLSEKGLEFSSHGQVIGAYGLHFAKTKELDPKFHRWLVDGFGELNQPSPRISRSRAGVFGKEIAGLKPPAQRMEAPSGLAQPVRLSGLS